MLYHFKSDNKYTPKEELEQKEKECREQLYDAIKDNIEFFGKHPKLSRNNSFYYTISVYNIAQMTLEELFELQTRFNKSATGLFGIYFDNCAKLLMSDLYGFLYLLYVCKYKDGTYQISLWDYTGRYHLIDISTKEEMLNNEQINILKNAAELLKNKRQEKEASRKRYEEIKSYKEFIKIESLGPAYARTSYKVTIDKQIPIELTLEEVGKYCDDWNYCFGGEVKIIENNLSNTVYHVTVYTD